MADNFDYEKLAKAIKGGFSPGSGIFDKLTTSSNLAGTAVGALGKTFESSLKTWRDLSKNGANFSNDLIGMNVAAAKGRMSLEEFGEVVRDNVKNFTGLGGNATRGAEAFAKFSEQMAKQGVTDSLRQLGYTSKEANDLLALQLATTRSSQLLDEQGRIRAAIATKKLADEMDLTAKLTGRSRKEQEERLKALQLDAQVENKIRLETRGMRKEEAEAYRTNIMRVLKEAQERGTGEMAKERFATGTVTSEKGAMQAALYGEEYSAMDKAFKAIQEGQTKVAEGYEAEAKAANLRAQDNPNLQMLGALGEVGGPAAAAINQVTTESRALYDATQRIKEKFGELDTTTDSYKKLLAETIKQAQSAQQGLGPTGERVDGALQTALAIGKAMEDGRAILASGLEAAFKKAANDVGASIGSSINSAVNKAYKDIETAIDAVERLKSGDLTVKSDQLGLIGTGINLLRESSNGLVELFTGGKAKVEVISLPKEAGDIIPMDKVKSSLPMPPAPEEQKSFAESMAEDVRKGMKAVGVNPNMKNGSNNIDLKSISKEISTSISSVAGGSTTTTKIQSDESKSAEKELQSVKEQYAAERTALAAKFKEMMPDASVGERRRAMNASDESKELNAKYDALMKPLEKKIEDGIKWETATKKEAVEETKIAIKEELSVIQSTREKISETIQDASDEEILATRKLTEEQIKIRDSERNEILKAAETHKDIVGKSVKGMADEAIEKLLPAGSKIDDFYVDISGNLQSFASDSAKSLQKVIENEKLSEQAQVESLARINENRKKVNTDEVKIPTNVTPIIKQDQLNKPYDAALEQTKSMLEQLKEEGIKKAEQKGTVSISDITKFIDKGFSQKDAQAAAEKLAEQRVANSEKLKNVAVNEKGKINLSKLNIPGINFGPVSSPKDPSKPAIQTTTDTADKIKKEEEAKTAAAEKAKKEEEAKKAAQSGAKDDKSKGPAAQKAATLDDVVKSLDRLNIQMGQLISQQSDLVKRQTSAMIASTSGNIYDKTR